MLSGFCRMTVSLVVIMFELTGTCSPRKSSQTELKRPFGAAFGAVSAVFCSVFGDFDGRGAELHRALHVRRAHCEAGG